MPEKSPLTAKEKLIKDILLTQIESVKTGPEEKKKIWKEGSTIKSTQHYGSKFKRALDPDMSDIAIAFYKALYKDTILKDKREILLEDGSIIDREFAGDTILTVKSLRYVYSRNNDTDESELEKCFQHVDEKIHCLANFWVIPMRHGRRSKKLNYYDSPDLYLEKIRNNFDEYKEMFPKFFDKYSVSDMVRDLCFEESEQRRKQIADRDINIFRSYEEAMDERADLLARDKTDELYELFSTYGLTDR
ncbi:hypothetical protein bpr_IV170 (plasmid) [Butyrivibrio proteoclasticus B316]|uniref:Uncharacterized protein n=2 Tax=Butyrivibrio proteoclasticus TaxID=43305 RepID=E0S552_BUTPB|nr:hypothetical protein bpr_IV170 [Butyrivibrio proteoclasticus B316]